MWGVGYFRPVLFSSVKSANYGSSGMGATAEPGKPAPARTSRETGDWNCFALGSERADAMLNSRQSHYISDVSKGLVFQNNTHAWKNPFVPADQHEKEQEAYTLSMKKLREARQTTVDP